VSFDSLPRIPLPPARPQLDQPATWPTTFPAAVDAGYQVADGGAGGNPASLSIAATGGYCDIAIDGERVGVTPLAELKVAPGRHHVVCSPPGQAPVEAEVDVSVARVTRYRFALTAQLPETNPYR
jgi:hypothetical protein